MSQPLVSIIMGAYNEEKTITKCLDSIIAQTYNNWELIICNDCSRDNTRKILDEYACKDRRIIVLNNDKNLRLAASLNRCLEVVKGVYVARMDADDEALPERLERQVEYLKNHTEIDCVGCGMNVFDENGNRGIRRYPEYPSKETLLKQTPFPHPTIMMKRSVYKNLGGYSVSKETMRAEDLDLWFRFYERGYKGYNIQEPLYRYHESKLDLTKRTLKAAVETSKVYFKGYRKLGFPIYKYIYAIKPIIAAIIPKSVMMKYYSTRMKCNTK